jgi:protocatechuate 3,4-dioxygenase beta subunit
VAKGVPLTIRLKVLDTATGSVGREGAAVYLWHCDIDGRYSLYSEGVTKENYLRGVQEPAATGRSPFRRRGSLGLQAGEETPLPPFVVAARH